VVDEKPEVLPAQRQGPIEDPLELLDTIKDAILRRQTDPAKVTQALRQVLSKFEVQNRVFLVASAQSEVDRIVRILKFLSDCEAELFDHEKVKDYSVKQLTRLYALAQSNLLMSMDNVRKVADMRLDMMNKGDATNPALLGAESPELEAMASMPGLAPSERDRVRKLMSRLNEAIEKDDSVVEDTDDDDTEQEDEVEKDEADSSEKNEDRDEESPEVNSEDSD